ncbi:MAG: HEPN domain-containing protein [Oscillospiraceae bacterium]|nr:HEPN domain-containing protein [Oscillospiraceae bacterium]
MIPNEKIQYWFDLADEDLSVAKILIDNNKLLYAAFMCHQVVEKALKGIIARDCAEDEIPPKIHHLTKLAKRALLFEKLTEEQKSLLADINPLNIEARYPEYKRMIADSLTLEKLRKLIAETEELLCWIKTQL